jgi:hypothetical protein
MSNDGSSLENKVFDLVRKMLDAGELPYQPEMCRLYRRKSYFSPDRRGKVNFEDVLEVFVKDNVAGADTDAQPTHVIFFECKDTGRNVEVGEVDEVVGRLKVSFGFSMKAYVVTRKGFSRGALETARSNGIGLLKIMPDDKVEFRFYFITPQMLERARRDFPQRAIRALVDDRYVSDGEDFYGSDGGQVFSSLDGMLRYYAKACDEG